MIVFISDIHLGSRHAKAEQCYEFLCSVQPEKLYLVGDIIDGWRLQKKWYWPQKHTKLLKKIVTLSQKGTEVIYVTGNHDEFLRSWAPCDVGKIKVVNRADLEIEGKKYLVIHGDFFDYLMRSQFGQLVMKLGDKAYDAVTYINLWITRIRRWLGLDYWSLSRYLKSKAKNAANYIGNFEGEMAKYARSKGYDGIIAGHIHSACNREIEGIHYLNTGDWVESMTAIIYDGKWKIKEWKSAEKM